MRYIANSMNRRKTSDPTMDENVTYENYLALLTAILIDENIPGYKTLVFNKRLFDREEEKKRLAEIEKIRSLGGKTELQVWYYNSVNGEEQGNNKSERGKALIKRALKGKHHKREEIKNRIENLYNGEIIDVQNMNYEEIVKFKIKAINIETGEIKVYNSKELCSQDLGIGKRNIITYIRKQSIYKGKYVLTISHERVDEESIKTKTVKIRAINIKTGEVKDFDNLRVASEFFNMKYVTFQQKITYKKDKCIGNWEVRRVR